MRFEYLRPRYIPGCGRVRGVRRDPATSTSRWRPGTSRPKKKNEVTRSKTNSRDKVTQGATVVYIVTRSQSTERQRLSVHATLCTFVVPSVPPSLRRGSADTLLYAIWVRKGAPEMMAQFIPVVVRPYSCQIARSPRVPWPRPLQASRRPYSRRTLSGVQPRSVRRPAGPVRRWG
jgi:hypothetical protein